MTLCLRPYSFLTCFSFYGNTFLPDHCRFVLGKRQENPFSSNRCFMQSEIALKVWPKVVNFSIESKPSIALMPLTLLVFCLSSSKSDESSLSIVSEINLSNSKSFYKIIVNAFYFHKTYLFFLIGIVLKFGVFCINCIIMRDIVFHMRVPRVLQPIAYFSDVV